MLLKEGPVHFASGQGGSPLRLMEQNLPLNRWGKGSPSGPSSQLQAAITEQEFRLARHYGLRRLVFIDQRADAERDPLLEEFLREEAAAYRGGVYPRPYADEQALGLALTSALSALRPRVSLAIRRDGAAWQSRSI